MNEHHIVSDKHPSQIRAMNSFVQASTRLYAGNNSQAQHSAQPHRHYDGNVDPQERKINDVFPTLSQYRLPDLLAHWDEHIKIVRFALNISVVDQHGISLLVFFFFGLQCLASMDSAHNNPPVHDNCTSLDPRSVSMTMICVNIYDRLFNQKPS